MTRWTEERLDQLAGGMEQLIVQLQQFGQRVEQTCNRIDAFIEASRPEQRASQDNPTSDLARLTALETQVKRLTQQVQYLERRQLHLSTSVQLEQIAADVEANIEDDVEDEPDEILWDFFDPAERQK